MGSGGARSLTSIARQYGIVGKESDVELDGDAIWASVGIKKPENWKEAFDLYENVVLPKFLARYRGIDGEDAQFFSKQIYGWFSGWLYSDVRFEYNDGSGSAYAKRMLPLMDQFIENSPKFSGPTYRGSHIRNLSDIGIGDIISMNGPASWSTSQDVAEAFANGHMGHKGVRQGESRVIYRVLGPQTHAASVVGLVGNAYAEQHEIASASNATYRVVGKSKYQHASRYWRGVIDFPNERNTRPFTYTIIDLEAI